MQLESMLNAMKSREISARGGLSLGRFETLEFVTGQIRQPAALLSEEMDASSYF